MRLWSRFIKPFLKKIGVGRLFHRLRNVSKKNVLKSQSHEKIFTDIYKSNAWNGQESASGRGSDRNETKILEAELPALLARYNVQTMIDLPCGDFNWMQHLDYPLTSYTGIDIVDDIVRENNRLYGNDKRVFVCKNCLQDDIGSADLLLCRDLLIHFSTADIFRFFENLKRADIPLLLTTHFLKEKNYDVATGQWRPVNLVRPPFSLPEPQSMIVEKTKMGNGQFAESKTMSLWRTEDIFKTLKVA